MLTRSVDDTWSGSPRHFSRGPIEADYGEAFNNDDLMRSPRHFSRGPIEAYIGGGLGGRQANSPRHFSRGPIEATSWSTGGWS